MTIGLFLLIGGILNFIAFIVCLLLIDDIRIFAFIIFLFIPYTFAIGAASMGIVCLVEKIRELL
jgi:hypothetical protein